MADKTLLIQTGARAPIYFDIEEERKTQDLEWGGPEHDDEHSPADWGEFISKHMVRALDAPISNFGPHFRCQMVRVAALAVAAIESYDRFMQSTH